MTKDRRVSFPKISKKTAKRSGIYIFSLIPQLDFKRKNIHFL
ncbi:hypothetical protein LEP1GSC132_3843 [Leptospira kirschneri str. 200803703]|nr:hypothetical protein LEP1GSC044_1321 [Leptospira kirschneri serovar Grippotyphosa str. RM52]EKQ83682.1 hypothetical protein LEP1GSC064_0998 [Leptospira kirschneri serovar Grippotyphosa str. Moskva]EKR08649.1 hypothetical protein LEP1GSC122_1317 [Leptospira kirschneri serovar Valbuzzi str. 200702274]EMK07987.1 hypothetical protein LEP1GSC176_2665 [Leptospira kirschneri str. MMD1493]EMK18617.1 hypothetical protein LEP1GSC042_1139 [Leptospira kirschneri serovar Bim str. PUO 1247]EMN05292.1 hyp